MLFIIKSNAEAGDCSAPGNAEAEEHHDNCAGSHGLSPFEEAAVGGRYICKRAILRGQGEAYSKAEGKSCPAECNDGCVGVSTVVLGDIADEVGSDHEAEHCRNNEAQAVQPQGTNSDFGGFVNVNAHFIEVAEPCYKYDFNETTDEDTEVVDKVVNDIEQQQAAAGGKHDADQEAEGAAYCYGFFAGNTEFIDHCGSDNFVNGDHGRETGNNKCHKEEHPEEDRCGHQVDSGGQGDEGKAYTSTGNFADGNTLLLGHVAEHAEDHDTGDYAESAVDENSHAGVVVDVGLFGQVAGVRQHDTKPDGEAEEDLAECISPDFAVHDGGEIWLEEPVDTVHCSGEHQASSDEDKYKQEEKGHEDLVYPFNTGFNSGKQGNESKCPGCGGCQEDRALYATHVHGGIGQTKEASEEEVLRSVSPSLGEGKAHVVHRPCDNYNIIRGNDE